MYYVLKEHRIHNFYVVVWQTEHMCVPQLGHCVVYSPSL